MSIIKCRDKRLDTDEHTLIMGILNVTPDSFSDGGKNFRSSDAVRRALEMVQEGADIIDIGGESTRPGYTPVSPDEEIRRIVPVIEAVSEISDAVISVDTYKASVAEEALKAGAHIINDIYGLLYDPLMAETVVRYDAGVVLMFNTRRNGMTGSEDIVTRAIREVTGSIETAKAAGISEEYIITDPGVGFTPSRDDDLRLMENIDRFSFGKRFPVLLGCSRKRVAASLLAHESVPEERDNISIGLALGGVAKGASILRVHNVKATKEVLDGYERIVRNEKNL
ncbi:MAG: dihydropteroate synthase [Clostridiales bacterium]|nr:dihydropteroate synthase [Clostridiales bacterium]